MEFIKEVMLEIKNIGENFIEILKGTYIIAKQKRKINTLELKIETLENTIKDEVYKEFMEKLREPIEIERLKNDNKRLRKKVKQLKELIKEEEE